MGRDGCDNLQTCALNEHSPLPQPKTEGVIDVGASGPVSVHKRSRDLTARYAGWFIKLA